MVPGYRGAESLSREVDNCLSSTALLAEEAVT